MKTTALQFLLLLIFASSAQAGNCLVQGSVKIGDCDNVHIGPAKPLQVRESGSHQGNFGRVTVHPGVQAYISGNTGEVTVHPGARLNLSGNSAAVHVAGFAELSGNTGWVTVAKGGSVVIWGISSGVSGAGQVVKQPGSIVGGVYIKTLQSSGTASPKAP